MFTGLGQHTIWLRDAYPNATLVRTVASLVADPTYWGKKPVPATTFARLQLPHCTPVYTTPCTQAFPTLHQFLPRCAGAEHDNLDTVRCPSDAPTPRYRCRGDTWALPHYTVFVLNGFPIPITGYPIQTYY